MIITISYCDHLFCSLQAQTPPLGWHITQDSSFDEPTFVNDYNDEQVCLQSGTWLYYSVVLCISLTVFGSPNVVQNVLATFH